MQGSFFPEDANSRTGKQKKIVNNTAPAIMTGAAGLTLKVSEIERESRQGRSILVGSVWEPKVVDFWYFPKLRPQKGRH